VGDIFTLGTFLIANIFGYFLDTAKCVSIFTKYFWGPHFGRFFSQTHLVALPPTPTSLSFRAFQPANPLSADGSVSTS
jgi:hypothetical protein